MRFGHDDVGSFLPFNITCTGLYTSNNPPFTVTMHQSRQRLCCIMVPYTLDVLPPHRLNASLQSTVCEASRDAPQAFALVAELLAFDAAFSRTASSVSVALLDNLLCIAFHSFSSYSFIPRSSCLTSIHHNGALLQAQSQL